MIKKLIVNPWLWGVLLIIAFVLICSSVVSAEGLALRWTTPDFKAVSEEPYCAPDSTQPLADSLAGHMVLAHGVIVADDTVWVDSKIWASWTVDSVYVEPVPTNLPAGIYYTRVRAFLKDPDNIRRDPCWSNVVQIVIRDTCPSNKIDDFTVVTLPE